MKIKIKKLHPNAKTPTYATDGSGCFDLYAATVNDAQHIGSHVYEGAPAICDTGFAFEIPPGNVMLIFSRSGHGFNFDTRLGNAVGIVDSDYRGSVKVKLTCDIDAPDDEPPLFISPGDRVAQAMVIPFERVEFPEVEELTDTVRGANGFGSTGQQ